MLLYPKQALAFSYTGLHLWFETMIPVLLPFMILTSLLVEMGLSEKLTSGLNPIIGRIFRLSGSGIYALLTGFLCGFPMGARTIALLYQKGEITKKEAAFLLSFCNNIGPVYFLSFVILTLNLSHKKLPLLFGMYGIPLLYGLVLRNTVYLKCSFTSQSSIKKAIPSYQILKHLDTAILSGLSGISRLGGYMVFFNLLNLLPDLCLKWLGQRFSLSLVQTGQIINCLLEITSGIGRLQDNNPLIVLVLLPFGGFSCIAQTYSMIRQTDLSIREYTLHKVILTLITLPYYLYLLR